jgi:hypothetical protein
MHVWQGQRTATSGCGCAAPLITAAARGYLAGYECEGYHACAVYDGQPVLLAALRLCTSLLAQVGLLKVTAATSLALSPTHPSPSPPTTTDDDRRTGDATTTIATTETTNAMAAAAAARAAAAAVVAVGAPTQGSLGQQCWRCCTPISAVHQAALHVNATSSGVPRYPPVYKYAPRRCYKRRCQGQMLRSC